MRLSFTAVECPHELKEALQNSVMEPGTNLDQQAELRKEFSLAPQDIVFYRMNKLRIPMEETHCEAHASLTDVIQQQANDCVLQNPGLSIRAISVPPEVEREAFALDANLVRQCLAETLGQAARNARVKRNAGTNEISIECRTISEEALRDLPCALRGCDHEAVTPRIHMSTAAPIRTYLMIQCRYPWDDAHAKIQSHTPSPTINTSEKEDPLMLLVRTANGFCGEMSSETGAPSTHSVWFALPHSLPEEDPRLSLITTETDQRLSLITAETEQEADAAATEHGGEEEGGRDESIQRVRSLSSEEDPHEHRISTRAALDADSPAHRALRTYLTATLPPQPVSSVGGGNYVVSPFFDPEEAARFSTGVPFPAYPKRLSRKSLMLKINAAFPVAGGNSSAATPVNRWRAVPGSTPRGSIASHFSSDSTDAGGAAVAGLSVKGKPSPYTAANVNPFALPSSAKVDSAKGASAPAPAVATVSAKLSLFPPEERNPADR